MTMAMMSRFRGTTPLLLALLLARGKLVTPEHIYTDSFPTNDEYDDNILDPNSAYGSPYGGFSRATRSRLAALPLPLPGADVDIPQDPLYMQMRDGDGRLFACRVYHEDEVAAGSLTDSVFTTVKLKEPIDGISDSEEGASTEDPRVSNSLGANDDDGVHSDEFAIADDSLASMSMRIDNGQRAPKGSSTTQASNEVPAKMPSEKVTVQQITSIFTKLTGICTQMHKGWWSYEWCHGEKVTQFHIHINENAQPGQSSVRIDDVTKLGTFVSRLFVANQDTELEKAAIPTPTAKVDSEEKQGGVFLEAYAEGEVEVGRITDTFVDGDICPATQLPRTTIVYYRCCSIKTMNALKSGVLLRGKPIVSNIAAAISLEEPSTCMYEVTVCTPLLCKGLADQYEDGVHRPDVAKKALKQPSPLRRPRKENESIRETLNRVLDNVCLQKATSEWWSYELCHSKNVRQYHENSLVDPLTGITSKAVEAENILGLYVVEKLETFPNEQEGTFVVNVTGNLVDEDLGLAMSRASTTPQRGNGAYFKQEYSGGDACENNDVASAVLKVERATTVRFFCGPKYELTQVNEDSTCHYIVDVTIPDLCENPLFNAPLAKKQVIKCLPVEESSMTVLADVE
jgi:Glucosidase II beta subunit-like protein